jgi:mannonate dehydratase
VGEVFNSIWDCKQLIEEQLIDYIRTTITHAGDHRDASHRGLRLALSGAYRLARPVGFVTVMHAAALHFDLWVPNFGVQEYMGYSEQMLEVFPHSWRFDNGYMHRATNQGWA